jgi:hypothetical protein
MLLPLPAFAEGCHRSLARRLVALRRCPVLVVTEGQRPQAAQRVLLWRLIDEPRPSFFRRRKPKDEKRLFICERRLRNPHAPRFSAPKIFRGTVAQYLPSRAYRLVTSSFEVREFHSYAVDFGAIIFNMEIVSGHDSALPFLLAGAPVSLCHRRQGIHLPVIRTYLKIADCCRSDNNVE